MGASGYIGGELVRLLLDHPEIELVQATSDAHAGRALHVVHPNLYQLTRLRFTPHDAVERADVLFLALPHGEAMRRLDELSGRAQVLVDASADFRIRDPERRDRFYQDEHPCPEAAARFVTGLPELYRDQLAGATWISVPGCMAAAAILALHPLAAAGLVAGDVLVDARTGSSGSGGRPTAAGQHAERSGVLRIYEPLAHRHQLEIDQACGVTSSMMVTAVEAVRGVQVVVHARLGRPVTQRELAQLYHASYARERFVRLVVGRRGIHRWPEPKILAGTNFCDVGYAVDPDGCRVVLIAALDNLMKGGAGNAIQSLNVAAGFDEAAGLRFAGLHPA